MKTCRLQDAHYLKLLEQSGLIPTVLNFYYDHFKNIVGRPPTLRELPNANSSNYLKEQLEYKNGVIQKKRLLDFTNSSTVEEAIVKLNQEYNDQFIEATSVEDQVLIKFTSKPSKFTHAKYLDLNSIQANSFIEILDGEIHINENEYLKQITSNPTILHNPNKVYTDMCKELSAKHNINSFLLPEIQNIDLELGVHSKSKQPSLKIYLKNQHEKGYFELVKAKELGFYTVHFKTATEKFNYTNVVPSTKEERSYLYDALIACLPPGACISTWDDISEGGVKGLERLSKSLSKVGERLVKNKENSTITIPVLQKESSYNNTILPLQDIQKIQNQFNTLSNELIDNSQLVSILEKLKKSIGIQTIQVTSQDIKDSEELSKIPNILNASAFVHQGNIYVNTDFATTDSSTHELLHILLGQYKTTNYNDYMELIGQASQFMSFQRIASNYYNRAQSDIYEEVFVEEVAKWLTGKESIIPYLSDQKQYDLQFSIYNVLDSIILGKESVESFKKLMPLDFSIKELSYMLDKRELDAESIINNSASQRALSNLKENLINSNNLIEIC